MTSYTLQVQPQTQYVIEYSNQRGPQGATGPSGAATTDASLLVSGTLADARLSSNVALLNAANTFTQDLAATNLSGTNTGDETPATITTKLNAFRALGSVPPMRTGMELWFAETFENQTDLVATWTTKTNSTLFKGGVLAGPKLRRTDDTEYTASLAVPRPTAAQIASGYTVPMAELTLPTSGFSCISFWFRVAGRRISNSRLITLYDAFNNNVNSLQINVATNEDHRFTIISGESSPQTSAFIPTGEWVQAWCAVDVTAKQCTWSYRLPNGLVTQFAANPVSLYGHTKFRLFPFSATANNPVFSGQISGLRIYTCQTLQIAKDGPTDYVAPKAGVTYTVSQSGSDSNYLGPWLTVDRAVQAINDCVVMGSANNFYSLEGIPRDYLTLANVTNRRGFLVDYERGRIITNPVSDTISIEPGLYRSPVSATAIVLQGIPVGITIQGSNPNQTPEIRFGNILTGTWTVDVGNSRVWKYSTTVPLTSYVNGPGRVAFTPTQATSEATAKTQLQSKNWGNWISPSGELFISLPTGTTPTSLAAQTPSGVWEVLGGGWIISTGGLIKNLKLTGVGGMNYYQTGPSGRVLGPYGFSAEVGLEITSVIDSCISEGYSKHVFGVVGTAKGMVVFVKPRYGGQCPRVDNAWDGAAVGDWSSLVDYSQDTDGDIVTCYIDPDQSDVGYFAVPGQAIGARWTGAGGEGSPYYSHSSGAPSVNSPFALTIMTFPRAIPTNFAPTLGTVGLYKRWEVIEGKSIPPGPAYLPDLVSRLPSAASNKGVRTYVTDSNVAYTSANLGATVAGAGANFCPVFSNGTNWVIG